MRYGETIVFVWRKEGGRYDPVAGDYTKPTEIRTTKQANISAMTAQRQQVAYGDVKNTRFTIRLQREYKAPFSHIEYEGDKYTIDADRTPRNSTVLTVIRNG